MADEKKNALVEALGSPRLPAKKTPTPVGKEPVERQPAREPAPRGRRAQALGPSGRRASEKELVPAKSPTTPVTEFYKVNGVEYTKEQLLESGMLPNLVTTYEQHGHLQKLHLENLRELEEAKKNPVPATRQATPEQVWVAVKQQFAPLVKQAIDRDSESGEIEADVVELYPETINTLYTRILYQEARIEDLRDAVWQLQQATKNVTQREVRAQIEGKIGKELDVLAKTHAAYGLLDDQDTRGGFVDYLFSELNPSEEQVTGARAQEFLAKQWFAYNAEALQAANEGPPTKKVSNANASGESPAARPGNYEGEEESHLDQLVGARLPVHH